MHHTAHPTGAFDNLRERRNGIGRTATWLHTWRDLRGEDVGFGIPDRFASARRRCQ